MGKFQPKIGKVAPELLKVGGGLFIKKEKVSILINNKARRRKHLGIRQCRVVLYNCFTKDITEALIKGGDILDWMGLQLPAYPVPIADCFPLASSSTTITSIVNYPPRTKGVTINLITSSSIEEEEEEIDSPYLVPAAVPSPCTITLLTTATTGKDTPYVCVNSLLLPVDKSLDSTDWKGTRLELQSVDGRTAKWWLAESCGFHIAWHQSSGRQKCPHDNSVVPVWTVTNNPDTHGAEMFVDEQHIIFATNSPC